MINLKFSYLAKDFKIAINNLQIGSLLIKEWIYVNKNERVFKKLINLIKNLKSLKIYLLEVV
ncbi:hypothetical protein [Spiroplasma turonicum]|uniref:hypothetical protein n=1 Tax=Spiroplasma turonicum TaxID=216946 RepID=UPI0009465C25|nr:hypothetical protein [Spiroplasma turonicum]